MNCFGGKVLPNYITRKVAEDLSKYIKDFKKQGPDADWVEYTWNWECPKITRRYLSVCFKDWLSYTTHNSWMDLTKVKREARISIAWIYHCGDVA